MKDRRHATPLYRATQERFQAAAFIWAMGFAIALGGAIGATVALMYFQAGGCAL